MRLLFDIETDGLLHEMTKVHCIGTVDVDTGEEASYGPDKINTGLVMLERADEIIGHNIIRFDIPALKKLYGFTPKAGQKVTDTLVVSRLKYPALKATDTTVPPEYVGKHSLAAWGHRLGTHKGEHSDWTTFSEEMLAYMMQDVRLNFLLYKHLNPDSYAPKAVELEHRIAVVCDAIEESGFPFDLGAAQSLHVRLLEKKHGIETALKAQFGSWQAPVSPDPTKSWFVPKRDNKKLGYVAGQGFTKMKTVEFNPGSRDHIAKVLLDRGWKPTKFTPGGSPLLDEETIEGAVAAHPELAGVGEYLMLDKRLSQLTGAKHSLMDSVRDDGRIHGAINPAGCITGRASHHSPNLAQIPSAKKPFGADFRGLFRAQPGWKLVGADMQGLELRGLAHYLSYFDGGEYGRKVLDGDPHWATVEALGFVAAGTVRDKHNQLHVILREEAKRFVYATVYGAGVKKLGAVLHEALLNARNNAGQKGVDVYRQFFGDDLAPDAATLTRVGARARKRFAAGITGFGDLQDELAERIAKRGAVKGLDGRLIPLRKEHAGLNTLIQSAGAVLCKQWGADAYERLQRHYAGEFYICAWVHDEYQVACREEIATAVGETLVSCAQKAGEPYHFRIRLDSEYVIGDSWADTH